METTAEQTSVARELRIAASPETVWEFLVDPEKIRQWKGLSVSFEARPEAEYRIEVVPSAIAAGTVVEIDPPRRLVITWGWEPNGDGPNVLPPGASTLEYVLIPEG